MTDTKDNSLIVIGEKEQMLFKHISDFYEVKGSPNSLFILIAVKNNLRTFVDVLDWDKKVYINHQNIVTTRLNAYHIASNTNEKQWQLIFKFIEILQKDDQGIIEFQAVQKSDIELKHLMTLLFPDYDEEKFMLRHMKKIWKWYLIIKKYRDMLPDPEVKEETNQNEEK